MAEHPMVEKLARAMQQGVYVEALSPHPWDELQAAGQEYLRAAARAALACILGKDWEQVDLPIARAMVSGIVLTAQMEGRPNIQAAAEDALVALGGSDG